MELSGTSEELPVRDDSTNRDRPFEYGSTGGEPIEIIHDDWPVQFRGKTFRLIDDELYISDPGPPYCPHGCRMHPWGDAILEECLA